MEKIKFTKGELKRQRDALRQYERYLPTLQLKKQQLQLEIIRQNALLEEKAAVESAKKKSIESWARIFADQGIDAGALLTHIRTAVGAKNIAGVDLPLFEGAEYSVRDYDLFLMPPWVDVAVESLKILGSLREEINIIQKGIAILKQELRTTAQRVNLFEKVKIPDAQEAIRLIKIYIGDQMTNAVGRSKMAKRKIEAAVEFEKALV